MDMGVQLFKGGDGTYANTLRSNRAAAEFPDVGRQPCPLLPIGPSSLLRQKLRMHCGGHQVVYQSPHALRVIAPYRAGLHAIGQLLSDHCKQRPESRLQIRRT